MYGERDKVRWINNGTGINQCGRFVSSAVPSPDVQRRGSVRLTYACRKIKCLDHWEIPGGDVTVRFRVDVRDVLSYGSDGPFNTPGRRVLRVGYGEGYQSSSDDYGIPKKDDAVTSDLPMIRLGLIHLLYGFVLKERRQNTQIVLSINRPTGKDNSILFR
ncbi:hypothetical protein ARMGADRAFT_1036830 [Armillaria gallica]|uniref:Uncharacterized protein n=1 Tax=Armillaria gallica TaxID=47427 RepID=A0A2H3D9E0_ARMGA|nr:hypothetical protein ARMGADRAFT_1036830 [Armillaria gallica]